MPELPEVETFVRNFRPGLVGRRIVAFESHWKRNVRPREQVAARAMRGKQIEAVNRRGKLIVLHLSGGKVVLIHLRMSGRLEWGEPGAAEPRHVRAAWRLDSGRRLLLCDARKFGRIWVADDIAAAVGTLGPEPLDPHFTASALAARLAGRRRQIKPLLLDQSVVAGLGNIYTDESLFYARIHPLTRSDRLAPGQVRRLHAAIRRVLRTAIDRHGTTIDWIYPGGRMQRELAVYGRAGEPCRRCGALIVALRVGQRGTHVCPRCQPAAER
ncbi:MAG: bifunctional DNA-formamidopyrimidine glycosylase/DNA-(apurinic or apyrimidinic site) lyase [Phycisphaerales bacterium]|nr:bifunctional DNA-formamidopyrimidine glycosylase/DNA-(apurinic or apyrimidinic site) lyase [Phycisphaerales bacterium]